MKNNGLIRFSLTLIVAILAGTNSMGQQPTVLRESTPPATATATQTPTGPGQAGQVQQQLPPYYDYPYGSTTMKNRTLSVEQAVTLALDNAASFRQAQFEEQSASEDVKQARTGLLPQFSMPLTYWGTTPSMVRQPGDPLIASYVASSAINESIGSLSVSGTIDVAGKLRAELQRSRALLAAAHAGTMAARRNLVLATIDTYYGLALTRQRRRLADEALALAEGFLSSLEEQQKLGAVEETDILRARSAARSRRDELAQAQLSESLAMSQLRVLTGLDYSTHITVAKLSGSAPQVIDLLGYQEDAIRLRPELAQLDAQKRAALADARAARRELWPQLSYTLNGGFDAANFKPLGRYSGGSAMITLNVPIFNFGASKSRATQAELRARSLDVQRDNQVLQLKQEFYAARAGALSALDRTGFASQAAIASQQNLTLTFERYRSKKASLLEILDAEADYSSTRLEYYQAIVDYHSARARLELDPTQMFGKQAAPVIQPGIKAQPPCGLGREQAPKLDRFYLGMTESEIKQIVPTIQISAVNEVGVSNAEMKAADIGNLAGSSSFFEGVESISLKLTDGRLSYIRVAYPATRKWAGKSEFLSVMAPKFSLQADWKPFYDWRNKEVRDAEDLSDMAIECEGFRLAAGIGNEAVGGEQTPHYDLDDLKAAQLVKQREEERRRREEQQKVKP
ncbi:MAG: TolC family protein [Pyrinomonadaceae bacterium]